MHRNLNRPGQSRLPIALVIGACGVLLAAISVLGSAPVSAASPAKVSKKPSRQALTAVVPGSSTQLIVGIVDGWNDRDVVLHRFARKPGKEWSEVGRSWDGRLGSQGVAWGRGLHPHQPVPVGAKDKEEGDQRAPAGVFRLGTVFGYAPEVPHPDSTTYVQVTDHDLLVEDPRSPLYNTYVRLDHPAASEWEIANRMTLGDPAHELKVFVHHNTDPSAVSGKGSAILLHISRPSERSYTAGCTAMSKDKMYETVAWLDGDRKPLYVLLPQNEYNRVASAWGLPAQLVTQAKQPSTSVTTTHAAPVAAAPDTRKGVITPTTAKVVRIPVSPSPTIPVGTRPRTPSSLPSRLAKPKA